MQNHFIPDKDLSGFTLIELSIVLVIIGLIVGGVLVGRDLIKAAQIRATVSQLESYDAAVNTFHNKYNGLPGDLPNCTNFFSGGDCPGGGNSGNGFFEDESGSYVLVGGEMLAFWHHLYLANLIGDAMTNTGSLAACDIPAQPVVANTLPAAKIGGGNVIFIFTGASTLTQPGMTNTNLYRIAQVTSILDCAITLAPGLSPLEAFQIDSKKDDGLPESGTVQTSGLTYPWPGGEINTLGPPPFGEDPAPGPASCLASATAYNTSSANGVQDTPLCELLIRASF